MNIPLIRLLGQQLISPQFTRPEEVVGWMGAVQAQDLRSAIWAVGLRTRRCRQADVVDALRTGRIIRLHVMRPTWHFVLPQDVRWMIRLNRDRLEQAYRGYCREQGIDISEADYARSHDVLRRALESGRNLTIDALQPAFAAGGLPATDAHIRAYLWRAETREVVCGGLPQGGKLTYTLLDNLVPPSPDLSRQEALARLATGYLRSHVPATAADFVWWAGISLGEAQRTILALGNAVETVALKGSRTLYLHRDCRLRGRAAGTACLLPPYDEYLLGYADRTDVLPASWAHRAHNNRGIFQRIVAQAGQIVANWSERPTANGPRIAIDHWREDVPPDGPAADRAIKRYQEFMRPN